MEKKFSRVVKILTLGSSEKCFAKADRFSDRSCGKFRGHDRISLRVLLQGLLVLKRHTHDLFVLRQRAEELFRDRLVLVTSMRLRGIHGRILRVRDHDGRNGHPASSCRPQLKLSRMNYRLPRENVTRSQVTTIKPITMAQIAVVLSEESNVARAGQQRARLRSNTRATMSSTETRGR
jgi:hypothetical protein